MPDDLAADTDEIITISYRRSGQINELFAALAKAQGMYSPADRSGTGLYGTYATLGSILEATKTGREANDLAIIQIPSNGDDGTINITTILGHSSGQWIESTLGMAPAKYDAQGAGSVITYLRKYAAGAILGTAPEDDDGEAAVREPDRRASTQGSIRVARPTRTANRPVDRPSGGLSDNGEAKELSPRKLAWIKSLLAEESYEIDPKKTGDWSSWQRLYFQMADHCDSEEQITKLVGDNSTHLKAFEIDHQPEEWIALKGHIGTILKKFRSASVGVDATPNSEIIP